MPSYSVKPPLGATVNKGHPLARGMSLCMLFNEPRGRYWRDLISEGAGLGTSQDSAQVTSAVFQKTNVVKFSGSASTSRINVTNNTPVQLGTSDYSFSWHCYATAIRADQTFLDHRNTGSPYTGFVLARYGSTNSLEFEINGASRNIYVMTCSVPCMPATTWVHNVLVVDRSGNARLWQNNLEIGTAVDVSGSAAQNVQGANPVKIGGHHADGNYGFQGYFNHFYIWKRLLSLSEIKELYANPYKMITNPKGSTAKINISSL